jgi:spore germination protein PD
MILDVTNIDLNVGQIKIMAVSSSSVVLVGDTNSIQMYSAFDTPADSLIVGPLVPIAPGG